MNLEREIITSYINALVSTRRALKGIRINFLPLCNEVEKYGGRARCSELAKVAGLPKQNMYNKLMRGIKAGYIEKNGFYYSVTPYGKMISEELSKNFAPHLARIKSQLLAELREQI